MFYIHHTVCISPQISFPEVNLDNLLTSIDNKLYAKQVSSADIPPAILRRMGKAVKMAVSASGPLLKHYTNLDGIIIGTANGGMEDCIKFLNQIFQYEEGVLTPTNFVQSTPNAIAAQLGFISKNKGYNITHVHRGLAFENALIDVEMLLDDNPAHTYLLGGLDEISDYNFNIEYLCGYIKKEIINNSELYTGKTTGSIAGEGVAMFVVNNNKEGAISILKNVKTIHTTDKNEVLEVFKEFLFNSQLQNDEIDMLLTGENGDERYITYSELIESVVPDAIVARYKHMLGEFQTASAFALWLANYILQDQHVPVHMVKKQTISKPLRNIIIYNNYQGFQHSFMLLSKV